MHQKRTIFLHPRDNHSLSCPTAAQLKYSFSDSKKRVNSLQASDVDQYLRERKDRTVAFHGKLQRI